MQPLGGASRPSGGRLVRFVGTSSHQQRDEAALPADHPAVVAGRSLFQKSVVAPDMSPRLLVSGHHNAKIGAFVTKGAWKGLPIYTFSLEERASCPATCWLWRECYGNAMPLARRHSHADPMLLQRHLERELRELSLIHPRGFVVRLHVLGDFFSEQYIHFWWRMLDDLRYLFVFGYTAHGGRTRMANEIRAMNRRFRGRCAIRFSVPPDRKLNSMQTTVWWEGEPKPRGIICPAQTEQTATCGTCGLCWAAEAEKKRIVFLGHGKRKRKKAHEQVA